MFCVHCGKPLAEDAAFCSYCGKPVDTEPVQSIPADPMPEPEIPEGIVPQETVVEVPAVEAPVAEEVVVPDALVAPPAPQIPEAKQPEPELPGAEEPAKTGKKVKTRKKKPHFVLRMFFQFFSFVLCLLLVVGLLATVALADLRQLTSGGGIKNVLDSLLNAPASQVQAETAPLATVPNRNALSLFETDWGDLDIDISDIPEDTLNAGNADAIMDELMEYVYDAIEEKLGEEELPFTVEELQEFLEESNVTAYVSDKLAGFADDFINGTDNTTITTEELMQLLEENEGLLKEKLNVDLTAELKEELREKIDQVVVEQDISNTIRNAVNEKVSGALESTIGVSMEDVQNALQLIVSDKLFFGTIGVCVAIALLLLAFNYYNLPAGLTWSSAACILVGFVVSAPLLLTELIAGLLRQYVPQAAEVLPLIARLLQSLAPLHYGLLIGGTVVFVVTMIWRIVFYFVNKKRPEAV